MRALLPTVQEHVDVHEFYATGWLDGGLRVNFIASVDGAVSAAGRSAGLQTPGDNLVFAVLRDLADVVVAGAGTVVAEGYRPISVTRRRRDIRSNYGLRPALPTAVISRTLRLDASAPLFADATADARTIVLTCADAPADRLDALRAVADVAICGSHTVEPQAARSALEERGFARILCEGGPTVFAELAGGGVVDELCLTVSPLLVGPGPARIVAGVEWSTPSGSDLIGLLEEDGALFGRYRLDRR